MPLKIEVLTSFQRPDAVAQVVVLEVVVEVVYGAPQGLGDELLAGRALGWGVAG